MSEFSKLVKSVKRSSFAARAMDAWTARNLKAELLDASKKKAPWPHKIKSFQWAGIMQSAVTLANPYGHYRIYEVTLARRKKPVILHFIPADDNALYHLKGRPAFKKQLDAARIAFSKSYKAQPSNPISLIIKPREA